MSSNHTDTLLGAIMTVPPIESSRNVILLFLIPILYLAGRLWLAGEKNKGYHRLPLPPGPKGFPILGNALQLPVKAPWLQFRKWAAIHGDVYYLRMLGQHVIVLNSFEAGYDLLHKRGAIYSDRPGMSLVRDHGGWKFSVVTDPYGEDFHLKRRFINQSLNPSATKKQLGLLLENIRLFVRSAHEDPSKIQAYTRMYTGANAMMMTYGHQVKSEDDEWVKNADDAASTLEASGTIGAHSIDMWPVLGKLPFFIWGQQFVEEMERMSKATYLATTVPYNIVKQQFFDGTALPSMATSLIEENLTSDNSVANEECINGSLAITYIAGADTTVASIETFIIAMIVHPEIQREAQGAIDDLLQGERLPTFDDRESLPYVEAILKEVVRWRPVVPGGIPHRSIEDDEYKGKFIPKGSMMIFNTIAMMYNTTDFPDPENFFPRRFLNFDGTSYTLRTDIRNPEEIGFGFGRRICPGRHFALSWLWVTIATFLAVFEISAELDADGNTVLPDLEYDAGFISHPKPFKCRLRLRPEMAAAFSSADGAQ
ncbi:cytochrome P450 [Sistotremastrum suecicum HHB10207 ss-3]|uniref:Cytochrome P450 n=1 Tax=Sistotremastrum suecicum HHB10207 ss-3 TaxID=1314776 RepID=A0A165Z204_9AGAM|nr:cytochrome P450 [Sistotremastrum suecicum HHB10207 ss-3]